MPRCRSPRETHTVTADRGGRRRRAWTRCRSASPPGASAPGARAPQDPVIHAAGIDLHVKPGDAVAAGQPLFTLLADDDVALRARARGARGRVGDRRRRLRAAAPARPRAHHGLSRHPFTMHPRPRTARARPALRRPTCRSTSTATPTLQGVSIRGPAQGVAARPPRRRRAPADDHRARPTRSGSTCPRRDADALADWFAEQSDSGSLVEYLKTFDLHDRGHADRARASRRVAREFVEDLAADGVIYGEVRWAPEQHLGARAVARRGRRGRAGRASRRARTPSSSRAATSASGSSSPRCATPTARSRSPSSPSRAAAAARSASTSPGPRTGFPPSRHRAAFDYLASEFFPATVHAGEAAGLDSIRSALIDGRALRLGHGVRIAEDLEVVSRAGRRGARAVRRPGALGARPRDPARALAVVEPADRRDRAVGRRRSSTTRSTCSTSSASR